MSLYRLKPWRHCKRMKNRDYIDQMETVINNLFEQHRETMGMVSREFFESGELKFKVQSAMSALAPFGFPPLTGEKFKQLYLTAIKECRHSNQLGMTPSISLTSAKLKNYNWLTVGRMQEIGWNNDEIKTYRTRYMKYLEKIGRTKDYIKETKRSSLEIVKKIGDPKSTEQFYIRGLVVGGVQSGKTTNFNAVINSAIDVGYDLIIVLSGIMEDLRRQTQERIEKEVEGKYIGGVFTGVAEISSFGTLGGQSDVSQIIIPTSTDTDFNKNIKEADFSLNNKNILVCKKNTSVLKNLILWLDNYLNVNKDKIEIPFLVIDDEADNASLNNLGERGKNYASTINGHIRTLLALFNKKTYLGYTATPFGNVLQDRHEAPNVKWPIQNKKTVKEFDQEGSLFPNDFIELLFPPPNYIGAKHFFETRLEEVKKIEPLVPMAVADHTDAFPSRVSEDGTPTTATGKGTRATNKDDIFPIYLPNSLKEAVMCFIVSTAIRISRSSEMYLSKLYQPHKTMLIHVSRFISWQTRTKKLVQDYVDELTEGLNNDFPGDKKSIYGEFERIWNKYYEYVMKNIGNYLPEDYEDNFLSPRTFEDIKRLLVTSIKDIEVKAINSGEKDSLLYPDECEKKYIAIGGNRLSRGFTLEGLMINYFIRNTNFADTLLQMGRWFGYRPGYLDCCKLFATYDALEKFDQTTVTIEDLEQKFIEMNRNPVNTPSTYALRVLKHPGTLKITRSSILKNSDVVNLSYSDHLIQTTKFRIEKERIEDAWSCFKAHISNIKDKFSIIRDSKNQIEYLEFQTERPEDLFTFLELPNTYYESSQVKSNNYFREIEQFIRLCNEKNKLTKWSIVIKVSGNGAKLPKSESGIPVDINKTIRGGQKKGRWFDELLVNRVFAAGGSAANIFSGGKDFQIRLTGTEIADATRSFREQLFNDLKNKYKSLTIKEIQKKTDKTTVPEKAYRRKMTENEGVLMIYLMDLGAVFQHKGEDIHELKAMKESLDTEIPLIGYAIGIPPVSGNIGGEYLQSKYHSEDDDEYEDYKEILEQI